MNNFSISGHNIQQKYNNMTQSNNFSSSYSNNNKTNQNHPNIIQTSNSGTFQNYTGYNKNEQIGLNPWVHVLLECLKPSEAHCPTLDKYGNVEPTKSNATQFTPKHFNPK